jgi:Fe-S-cluster containining protein
VPHVDSVDKIITRYFACVTAEPFTYKDVTYNPRPLHLSPKLIRSYTCPSHCGACCSRFSLDYIESEKRPKGLTKREVEFNGRVVPVWSDMQDDHDSHHCRNLRMSDGRCDIHGKHPFSCDFELVRFLMYTKDDPHKTIPKPNILTTRLYGRAHAMLRIDSYRGAKCEILDEESAREKYGEDIRRKLQRLENWCDHFGLANYVAEIIEWAHDPLWRQGKSIGLVQR